MLVAPIAGVRVVKNLLSNNIRIMTGLDLEVTVVCPQIDRVRNTSNTTLIHLRPNALS